MTRITANDDFNMVGWWCVFLRWELSVFWLQLGRSAVSDTSILQEAMISFRQTTEITRSLVVDVGSGVTAWTNPIKEKL